MSRFWLAAILALLALVSCDKPSPRGQAHAALPALSFQDGNWPDWGEPPQDKWDAAEEWPYLPQGAGWARFQGMSYAFNWHEVYCAGAGLLVMNEVSGNGTEAGVELYGLHAYRLSDGAPLWDTKVRALNQYSHRAVTTDAVICSWNSGVGGGVVETLSGLSLTAGEALWQEPHLRLLAAGPPGLWVTRITPQYVTNESMTSGHCQGLLLLSASTGKVLREFSEEKLYGYAKQLPADGKTMVVATGDHFLICHSDGSTRKLRRPRPGLESRLALSGKGLLELAGPPQSMVRADDQGWATLMQLNGKTLWQSSFKLTLGYGVRTVEPHLGQALAAAVDNQGLGFQGLDLWQRSSGERHKVAALDQQVRRDGALLGDSILIAPALEPDLAEQATGGVLRISLTSGKTDEVNDSWRVFMDAQLADQHLCCALVGPDTPAEEGALPYCGATLCAEVDEQLELRPGNLTLLDAPEQFESLVKRFYAASDPLHDQALMKEVIASGQRGLHRLFQAAKPAQAIHLDALVHASRYMNDRQQSYSSALHLTAYHLRALGPSIRPLLQLWQANPQLEPLHERFAAILSGKPIEPDFDAQS